MRMRFRTDGWHYADLKTWGWTFDGEGEKAYGTCFDEEERNEVRKEWDSVPVAEPGDVWRIHWHKQKESDPDVLAGYAICCPGCGHVHNWTTASNCQFDLRECSLTDKDGEHKYKICGHSGVGSCWNWTGSAEDNNLSATPSLQVIKTDENGCNWHGHITNGDIHN